MISFLEHYKTLPNPFRTWRDFLCDIQFHFVAILWMLTRVISNVSQVYLPLYIMDATDASQVDRVSFLCSLMKQGFNLIVDINCHRSSMRVS